MTTVVRRRSKQKWPMVKCEEKQAQEVTKTLEISHVSVKTANFASLVFKGFKDFAHVLAQRPFNNLRSGFETSLGDLNVPSHIDATTLEFTR